MFRPCPVCLREGVAPEAAIGAEGSRIECPVCGVYGIENEAYEDYLSPQSTAAKKFSPIVRASLSHRLQMARVAKSRKFPCIDCDYLERCLKNEPQLLTISQQCTNLIRFIANHVRKKGDLLRKVPPSFYAVIGAPNHRSAARLAFELIEKRLLRGEIDTDPWGPVDAAYLDLTMDGWEKYEAEVQGRSSGKYGFLAMKFEVEDLEKLCTEVIKPQIKEMLGFTIIDTRDASKAGIIDNLVRQLIRDSAFVLADLTHDNSGAYWEAGYAEGLGKPVIYVCERDKFKEQKTHFDTNHCTTVCWSRDDPNEFAREFIATIRNSLNLF